MLKSYFCSAERKCILCFCDVFLKQKKSRSPHLQVLITEKSCDVLKSLHQALPIMMRLKDSKMTQEQTKEMLDILDKLIGSVITIVYNKIYDFFILWMI